MALLALMPVAAVSAEGAAEPSLADAVRDRSVADTTVDLEPGLGEDPTDASSLPGAKTPASGPTAANISSSNAPESEGRKASEPTSEATAAAQPSSEAADSSDPSDPSEQGTPEPEPSRLTPEEVSAILAEAETGDADAQLHASLVFYNGEGVSRDTEAAAMWARKAAEQGHVVAARTLAALYYSGDGVPRDYAEAARWFQVGAEGGSPDAQYGLGLMYLKGQGLARNLDQAEHWFTQAAETGHLDAQFQLGLTHFLRNPANFEEAKRWYEVAAMRNHAGAQTNLGALYLGGLGVAQNGATAYMWISLAADQDFPKAKKYLELAKAKLAPAEVVQGTQAAARWRKQPMETAGEPQSKTDSAGSSPS